MEPAGKIAFLNIVVTSKKYHYQFVFAKNAKHVDRPTKEQTLPEALEYVWKGYQVKEISRDVGARPRQRKFFIYEMSSRR